MSLPLKELCIRSHITIIEWNLSCNYILAKSKNLLLSQKTIRLKLFSVYVESLDFLAVTKREKQLDQFCIPIGSQLICKV